MKDMSAKLHPGDELTVDIARIVPRGFGIGFVEGHTVFVALAAPGDRLAVRISEVKGNSAFAEIEKILVPGPDRIEPPCPYFGTCGGCDFQQLDYGSQLASKVAIVRDCLHRIGKIEFENIETIASPLEFKYRTRAQWHANTRDRTIGYYRRSSHQVIDIEHCPILAPELDQKLRELRSTFDWDSIWSEKIAIEAARGDDGTISVYSSEFGEGAGDVFADAAGERFQYSARSFFQGNRSIVDDLVRIAIDGAAGEKALDLYSGVGLFTIPLARRFSNVESVEENGEAVDYAEKNIRAGGIQNVAAHRGRVDAYVREAGSDSADFVLLDPPRAGGSKDTIRHIARVARHGISYVSCEPSILARDLRVLLDCGYSIERITAIDMFPQTHHVETVVRLSRQK